MSRHAIPLQQYPNVSSVSLVANMARQLTIRDSPDDQVRFGSNGITPALVTQNGLQLTIVSNMSSAAELQIPRGVKLELTNNMSTVTDLRGAQGDAGPSSLVPVQHPAVSEARPTTPLSSAFAPKAGVSDRVYQGVSVIEGVNQLGTIEILPAQDNLVRIKFESSAILNQEGRTLNIVNRPGTTMTIFAPQSVTINILNQRGNVSDRRFD